jgi:NADH dehydrogenase
MQRGDYLIPELNAPSLSTFACDKLRAAGVDVRLNSSAKEITAAGVRLTSGELIEAATVVSTVGTAPNPLIEKLGLALERGRVVTNPDMSVKGTENVWAVGDCAIIPNAFDQKPSPPTAQFAMRQAKQLAANLSRTFSGQPTKPFSFKVLGMLASLGNRKAVAEILGIRISGFVAWVLWRCIYLSKLPSFARKLEVVVDWTWKALFPPNIVQLPLSRTGSVGLAHYAPGEFIFRKGDPAESLFVIQSGTAGVYMDEPSNPIAVLKPGEHFGQEALGPNGQGPHRVTVKAETALDLITLRRDDFQRLAQSDATVRKSLQSTSAALKGYEGLMAMVKDNPILASIKISEVMTSPAETLLTNSTLAEAIGRFDGGRPSYAVVDESGRLQGYCGRAELFGALRELPSLGKPVSDFMRQDPPVIAADQSIIDAAVIMLREEIEMLPVVSSYGGGSVIGVVSPLDVIQKAVELFRRDSSLATTQG